MNDTTTWGYTTSAEVTSFTVTAELTSLAGSPEPEPETTPEPFNGTSFEPEPLNGTYEPIANPEMGLSTNMGKIMLVVFIVFIFLIVLGNMLVIVTILRTKILRTPRNFYILSLAFSDLLVGVAVVPFAVILDYGHGFEGTLVCKLCEYVALIARVASIYSIVAIASERWKNVMCPYQSKQSSIASVGKILPAWCIALVYAIRRPVTYGIVTMDIIGQKQQTRVCIVQNEYKSIEQIFVIIDFLFLFVFPVGVMLACYIFLIQRLEKEPTTELKATNGRSISPQRRENPARKAWKRRIVSLVTFLALLFIVCQGPYYGARMYYFYQDGFHASTQYVLMFSSLISFANSWLNVIAYACTNANLRSSFCTCK